MNLDTYLRPLLRWWRLILSATILAAMASGISTLFQPNVYISRTTLVVGTTILDPNPDSGQIYVAQQLAQIYADMALREPIQLGVMESLGVDWLPKYQSRVVPNTQIVEISVTDTSPKRAQIFAAELANQLVKQSPAVSGTQTGTRQDFISAQLSSLQDQIQQTQTKIEELQKSLVGLNSASQIANIEDEINALTQKLNTLRENYASFLANSQQGALNMLSVVEPANLPTRPAGTNRLLIVLLAGLVGFSLGTGAAYLLEYLDQTVRTTADVQRIFGQSVIGYISEIAGAGNKAAYVAKDRNSVLAESFRLLWSNIEFLRMTSTLKTILVTSPGQGNGKTTIASSLAVSIAQSEHHVVLVDADLRRPAVHTALKLSKAPGLCDVIGNGSKVESVIRSWNGNQYLKVLTVGNQPPNITEVVGSNRLSAILSDLKAHHELIIVDSPPLIIADAYNLASRVDGVIIVLEPGQTTNEQARALKEQLARSNAKILGFVFNKVTKESIHSYGDYQYRSLYSPKYYSDYVAKPSKKQVRTTRGRQWTDFFEHGKVPAEVSSKVEGALSALKKKRLKKNAKAEESAKSN